jgi:GDP-4-dehydro-6-deoxy-D-mannose reductase
MPVVVVTGASGFLGRHLCARLLSSGASVVALTRPQGRPAPVGVHSARCEQLNTATLTTVLARQQPEVIYHVAGSVDGSDVSALYEANVSYAARLLHAAAATVPTAKVLLVGSAAEYGRPVRPNGVVSEDDVCRPLSAYGISKLAQTHHGLAAAAQGLHVVVARVFNPIGPGSPASNALGAFARQIATAPARDGSLRTGPLNAVRDFVSVDDVARALEGLAKHPGGRGLVVNVCSGRGLALSDLVTRLLALSPVVLRHDVDSQGRGTSDIDRVVGDPSRLCRLDLGLPPLDVDSVLRRMLAEHAADHR